MPSYKAKAKKMSLKTAIFSQVYLPMIGWKLVMNPDDKELSDLHWELKVIFISLKFIRIVCLCTVKC